MKYVFLFAAAATLAVSAPFLGTLAILGPRRHQPLVWSITR